MNESPNRRRGVVKAAGVRAGVLLLGFYVGLLGAFVHRHDAELIGADVPWGLVLAILTAGAVAAAADRVLRLGSLYLGVGWTLALMAQQIAPGRGYLVAGDLLGWAFTLGGLGAIGAVAARNSRVRA